MTVAQIKQQALALKPQQRLRLVQDIWDSIARDAKPAPLDESEQTLLDERVAAHQRDPASGEAWSVVKRRVLAKVRNPRRK